MEPVFSTMIMLALKPLDAVKTLASNGLLIEIGFDNFQAFGGKLVEDSMLKELLEGSEELKRFVRSIHMPYDEVDVDAVPMDNIVKRMVKWLDYAGALGARVAVFHTLVTGSRNPLEVNTEFFRVMTREAMDRGIAVAVENRLEKNLFGSSPRDLKKLIESVGEGIGVCLDVGHANIAGNLRQFIESLQGHIIEMHLHDNDGVKDLHRPPQTGTVDWSYVVSFLKRKQDVLPVFEIICREGVKKCLELAKSVRSWFLQV